LGVPGVRADLASELDPERLSEGVTLEPQMKALVAVGAVGQPRDRDQRAGYVIVDGDTICWRRVPYDVEATVQKILATPALNEAHALRLREGI